MNYHPWAYFAFPLDVYARDYHAKDVYEEIDSDKDLPDHRDLDTISPVAKTVHHDRKGTEFEKRRYPLTEKGLVLRPDTEAFPFATNIGTNEFEHMIDLSCSVIRGSRALAAVPRL